MPVVMSCTCGMRLKVSEIYVGRLVKCPSCGTTRTVPDETEEPPAPEPPPAPPAAVPEAGMVQFACTGCGKPLRARAEFAGRATRCPDCQTVVTIGGTASPAYRPAPARPEPEPDPVAPPRLALDRPLDLRKRPSGGPAWPWLLSGGAALLLLAGGLLAWLLLGKRYVPPQSDLDLVPADAQLFISVQLGELWTNPTVKEVRGKLPPALQFALRQVDQPNANVDKLERMVMVMQDVEQLQLWVAVSAHIRIDRQDFLTGATQGKPAQERSFEGRTYHVFDAPQFGPAGRAAVYSPSDYIGVVGTEGEVRTMIQKGVDRPKAGPLADAIAKARARNHLVMAFHLTDRMRDDLLANMVDRQYEALFWMKTFLLTANLVNGKVEVEASATYPDPAKATEAKAKLDELKRALRGMINLMPFGADANGRKSREALKAAVAALEFTQNGSTVQARASWTVDTDAVAGLIGKIPNL